MERSMASYLASMREPHYEEQEREMTWNPISYHCYECTSTYQEELPYENYFQEDQYGYENQYGYGESYQPRDMEYEYEEAYNYEEPYEYEEASPSPSCYQEIRNLLELALEGQKRNHNDMCAGFDAMEAKLDGHLKDLNNKGIDEGLLNDRHEVHSTITPSTPTTIEESKKVGKDTIENYPLSEFNAPKEELKYLPKEATFLQEAKEAIRELEFLCVYTIDESCLMRNEDICEDVGVEECIEDIREKSLVENAFSPKEDMHFQPIFEQVVKVEEPIDKQSNLIQVAYKGVYEEGSPKANPFSTHHGITLTTKLGIDDRWKLPFFEEVRMKEFGGRFYDEYDPGDPISSPYKERCLTSSLRRKTSAFGRQSHGILTCLNCILVSIVFAGSELVEKKEPRTYRTRIIRTKKHDR